MMTTQSQKMRTVAMMKRMYNQKRKTSRLKEELLALRYTANGTKRETSSQKLFLRVMTQGTNSRKDYFKLSCSML
jgi:hypothetical protein